MSCRHFVVIVVSESCLLRLYRGSLLFVRKEPNIKSDS